MRSPLEGCPSGVPLMHPPGVGFRFVRFDGRAADESERLSLPWRVLQRSTVPPPHVKEGNALGGGRAHAVCACSSEVGSLPPHRWRRGSRQVCAPQLEATSGLEAELRHDRAHRARLNLVQWLLGQKGGFGGLQRLRGALREAGRALRHRGGAHGGCARQSEGKEVSWLASGGPREHRANAHLGGEAARQERHRRRRLEGGHSGWSASRS